jgi:malonate-semialdehyde dehydrogenase (acetylating)/methylmalonate-semialdehyde dehydrogenase
VRAQSYNEAVDMINVHEYGNGTAIFTRDVPGKGKSLISIF